MSTRTTSRANAAARSRKRACGMAATAGDGRAGGGRDGDARDGDARSGDAGACAAADSCGLGAATTGMAAEAGPGTPAAGVVFAADGFSRLKPATNASVADPS